MCLYCLCIARVSWVVNWPVVLCIEGWYCESGSGLTRAVCVCRWQTKGILGLLADLITKEIENLNQLEETTLNSDLSQGDYQAVVGQAQYLTEYISSSSFNIVFSSCSSLSISECSVAVLIEAVRLSCDGVQATCHSPSLLFCHCLAAAPADVASATAVCRLRAEGADGAAGVVPGAGVGAQPAQGAAAGHRAARLPVAAPAGHTAHQAGRRDPGAAAAAARGHHLRWVAQPAAGQRRLDAQLIPQLRCKLCGVRSCVLLDFSVCVILWCVYVWATSMVLPSCLVSCDRSVVCVCVAGKEAETRQFMAICVETVARYGRSDVRTPVFIFERLCSIIEPELNELGPFLLSLEKDPQQEDFLQVPPTTEATLLYCFLIGSIQTGWVEMGGHWSLRKPTIVARLTRRWRCCVVCMYLVSWSQQLLMGV